jgi:outer membrane protein
MIIAIALSIAVAQTDTLTLSLEQARTRALEANPALLAERAEARAQRAEATAATRAFLPSVHAEVTGVSTSDPVGVFGLKLRQGVFAAGDLALDALNDPAAFGGFGSSAMVEVPIFAPEGWYGFGAAKRGAEAREAAASRAAGAMAFMVAQAYLDAQLASERVAALDGSLVALRAHAARADAMRQQGLVTGLDARLASLQVADLEVRRLAADAEAQNTRSRLRALLAVPEGTTLILTDALAGTAVASVCSPTSGCAVDARGDIRALRAGEEATESARRSAWAAQLPQLAAFGGLTYHGRGTPWGVGSGDWTVGVAVRWNVFPALGGVAAVRKASATEDAARARHEAARRDAEVEVLTAERLLAAASEGAEVAARAEAESQEALAQATLRYETGTAPITELLDVQAAATGAALNLLTARRDVLLARAALDFAYGAHDR